MTVGKAKMQQYYGSAKLDEAFLRKVFLFQLGNILCIKNYLVDNLPILEQRLFDQFKACDPKICR